MFSKHHSFNMVSSGAATAGSERVRARKGHGASAKRPRPPLTWADLEALDKNMTLVAQRLALEYGYTLQAPQH